MKDYAEIAVLIDESGSMWSMRDDAIGGFNSFLAEQRKLPWSANLTVIKFNTKVTQLFEGPLKDAPELSVGNYTPEGGTALCDAVGSAVAGLRSRIEGLPEADRPSRVVVGILTDGRENSSREHTISDVRRMITEHQEGDGWSFVFLAADEDALTGAEQLGVARDMAFNYGAVGLRGAYQTLSTVISGEGESES